MIETRNGHENSSTGISNSILNDLDTKDQIEPKLNNPRVGKEFSRNVPVKTFGVALASLALSLKA